MKKKVSLKNRTQCEWPGFPLKVISCGPLDLHILNFVKL